MNKQIPRAHVITPRQSTDEMGTGFVIYKDNLVFFNEGMYIKHTCTVRDPLELCGPGHDAKVLDVRIGNVPGLQHRAHTQLLATTQSRI